MSKFACRCGFVMNLSSEDNEYEYSMIPEIKISEIIRILEINNNVIDIDDFIEKIDSSKKDILYCTHCKRFWVRNNDGSYNSYVKETE